MTSYQLNAIDDLPDSIQEMVRRLSLKLLENLGESVESILLYGSGVNGNFIPGVSNVNLAFILKKLGSDDLKDFSVLYQRVRRKNIPPPLLLTKEFILNSLDVFPIEFMEIKMASKVIFGADFFATLEIPRQDLKLLCEQQIKGKLLHLRQTYLAFGSSAALKNFVNHVFKDLMPIFRCLINLKGEIPSRQKEDMLRQLAQIFSLDEKHVLAIYHDRHKKFFMTPSHTEIYFQNLLNVLETLSRQMDSL